MKKLTQNQINLIDKKIDIGNDKLIVMLDVGGNKNIPVYEHNNNIYCINNQNEIFWQIKAKPTGFERDSFVNIKLEDDKLIAKNFSGFKYKVNLINGEVEAIDWDK